jgi:hypothetical protein
MRLRPKTKDSLLTALKGLPDEMKVEADDTGISAKTVGQLRAGAWPGGLTVVTPQEPGRPESVVKISRPDD